MFVQLTYCPPIAFLPVSAPTISFTGWLLSTVDLSSTSLYSGTVFSLICVVELVPEVDTPLTVLTSWDKDGSRISSSDRISVASMAYKTSRSMYIYDSNVTFNPLSNQQSGGDGGEYSCLAQVLDNDYITGNGSSNMQTVAVEG